jgi:hypothetical protein
MQDMEREARLVREPDTVTVFTEMRNMASVYWRDVSAPYPTRGVISCLLVVA